MTWILPCQDLQPINILKLQPLLTFSLMDVKNQLSLNIHIFMMLRFQLCLPTEGCISTSKERKEKDCCRWYDNRILSNSQIYACFFCTEEPETRDAWWMEIRTEIRSHMRAMGCHAVIGYSEHTSIW